MATNIVPVSDLPPGLVPPEDMPQAGSPVPAAPVEAKPAPLIPKGKGWGEAAMEQVSRGAYKAGGAVTDIAAKALPPKAAAALGLATNVGIQALPMMAGGSLGARVGAPAVTGVAKKLMQSSLKPTVSDFSSGKAQRAIDTMLKEGVNVTHAGLAKLRSEVDKLDKAVTDAIERSTGTVDKQKITEGMKDIFERFKNRLTEAERTGNIKEALQEFLNHPWIKNITQIPVKEAQELKRGIYQGLGEKAYGPQAIPAPSKEAQKGIARHLRTGIEGAVPEVAPLNARMGELINAGNVATRQALGASNRNPGGLGWMAHSPETFLAFELERSPAIKSALANLLYSNPQALPRILGEVPGAGVGMMTGRRD